MVKRLHQKHFKIQHQKRYLLKDLSLKNFILQHEQRIPFSFKKLIIPSVLYTLKEDSIKNTHKFDSINDKIGMIDIFLKKNISSKALKE